ncbi:MAG: carbon starvation protein A [Thermoanaerobacteraceae bacterium]|nr:carbon starvation protein A [Thermoanaerobacteraceae bacterium]
MVTFFIALAALICGYFVYGKFVEKVLGIDPQAQTPAVVNNDGVDYVPMDWKKIFLIQFLNIAGLGPIYGAIAGALWGPVAFLWIVFGAIFAGAVHDYFSGMLSIKHNGASISELVGMYLGNTARQVMRVFTVVLLILVGTVFMLGPAKLLAALTSGITVTVWLGIILAYYFLATILPVDKIIGRIYPLFGAALLIMAVGIAGGLIVGGYQIPELTLQNLHPKGLPIWPLLFVTIACGAISGFHATQSPLMARCVKNQTHGRKVFYGAMISEGIIALIWAAAAMTFFNGTEGLQAALAEGGPGGVVHTLSTTLLGKVGGLLAILGVIACPITSGDTAFRSARLTIADALKFEQKPVAKRLSIAIPVMTIGFLISQIDFGIVWRYFAWSNQTLAMMVLWTAAAFLAKEERLHWIATIPATFMTGVSITYILQAPEGLGLSTSISYPVGIVSAIAALVLFLTKAAKKTQKAQSESVTA